MGIRVNDAGMLTTVQDLGRTGFRQYGIPVSGALDSKAAAIANSMLGNAMGVALLEMTLLGPALSLTEAHWVCLTGADMKATLSSGESLALGRVYPLSAGERVSFGRAVTGCRGYLAIRGGLKVDSVLGSASTFLRGKVGGFHGRPLQAGDFLDVSDAGGKPVMTPDFFPAIELFDEKAADDAVRYIPNPAFSYQGIKAFEAQSYKIKSESDRMGYRLDGVPIPSTDTTQLISEGVTIGTIQLPSSGQPIILMNDSQTTGGYPKVGHVISIDLPKVAQLKPGDRANFTPVTLQEAQGRLQRQVIYLERLAIAAHHKWKGMLCD